MFGRKSKRRQVLTVLLLSLCICLPLSAEGEQGHSGASISGEPLSLQDCVRIALDGSPLLRATRLGAVAAEEAARAARAPYYPAVSAIAGYHRWDRVIFLPSGIDRPGLSKTVGETDEWEGAFQAEFLLYDSGRRRAELLASQAEAARSEVETNRTRQDLILLVHEAFFRLLGAVAEARAAEESLRRSLEHVRTTEVRLAGGDVPQADVLRARVEASDARLGLVQAENSIRVARADLNAAMGLPATLPIPVRETCPEPLRPAEIDLTKAVRKALDRRPELQTSEFELAAARHRTEAVEGAYGPQLEAEGRYGRRDDRFLPEAEDWSAGLSLRVPIFTGFEKSHRVAESRALLARSQARREQVGLQIRQDVVKAFSELEEAAQSVATTELMAADAAEGLRLTRARYENGAGTINDLLDAEAALARAEAGHAQALAREQIASARFLRATGGFTLP